MAVGHLSRYLTEHALDEVNEEFYKELKEALKRDVQSILESFNIYDEGKIEKLTKLIYEKCVDESESQVNLAKLLASLLHLNRLIGFIVKKQMRVAEKYNRAVNLAFDIPEIYKDIHEILFEKHGANTNPQSHMTKRFK